MNKLFTLVLIKKLWPYYLIVLLWIIFSIPFLFQNLVPFPSDYLVTSFPPWAGSIGIPVKNAAMPDIISQIYPWKNLTVELWKSGLVPLWNPYSFAGTPHAANFQSAIFAPITILFLLFKFLDAWSLSVLLQPLLGGIFTALFLTSLGLPSLSIAMGSVSFMFMGFMTCWMGYATLGWAGVFLPLAMAAINFVVIKKRSYGYLILIASIAGSVHSGHFQMSVYVIGLCIAYIVFIGWTRRRRNTILLNTAAVLAGLGIAAPQLLLTFQAFLQSVRSSGTFRSEIIPFGYLLTVFAPDVFGNPVTRNDWYGHYAEWATFIGTIPVIMVFYPASVLKKSIRIFFIITALFSLLLATPSPVNELLYVLSIPVLSGSAASRIVLIVSFSLLILSSGAMGTLVSKTNPSKRSVLLWAAGIVFFVISVWFVILVLKVLPPDALIIAKRNLLLPSILAFIGVVMITPLVYIKQAAVRHIIITLLVCLTAIDLFRFAVKWMSFQSREFVYPDVASASYLASIIGNDRAFGNFGGETSIRFKIPTLEGYDAMYNERYGEFIASLKDGSLSAPKRSVVMIDKHGKYTKEAFELLGVRYIYHKNADARSIWTYPYWNYPEDHRRVRYVDNAYTVVELTKTFPRVFLASSYKKIQNKQQIINELFSPLTDRRETLILETDPQYKPSHGSSSAEIVSYKANRIVVKTTAETSKLLFVSDSYDNGWKATIDGKYAPLLRANFTFRAISLPKGSHIIEMKYNPDYWIIGLVTSLASLIIGVGIYIKGKKDENRNS